MTSPPRNWPSRPLPPRPADAPATVRAARVALTVVTAAVATTVRPLKQLLLPRLRQLKLLLPQQKEDRLKCLSHVESSTVSSTTRVVPALLRAAPRSPSVSTASRP
ncbi:hypothetical protein ARTHRO9AX_180624 [Arthrobacter sp. 9AX]|nr:hypothetical protein ARTHRO9AX_180624 [Arthrobacter sp. 9AX]